MPGSFSRVFGPVAFALVLAAASACASSHHAASPVRDDAGDAQKSDAEHFSFFVTSLRAMQELSGNELGFGGDLRFGEDGPGAGLRGPTRSARRSPAAAWNPPRRRSGVRF